MPKIPGLNLPFGIEPVNALPVDSNYGPYSSLAEARSSVNQVVRYDGLTVMITGTGEYWWRASDLSDSGLIPKTNASSSTYSYVPYTGATMSVDLATFSISATSIISKVNSSIEDLSEPQLLFRVGGETNSNRSIIGGIPQLIGEPYEYFYMYSPMPNRALGFYTNNALQMTLNPSGNLGIGVKVPTARLSLKESNATTPIINFGQGTVSVTTASNGDLYNDTDSALTYFFRDNNKSAFKITNGVSNLRFYLNDTAPYTGLGISTQILSNPGVGMGIYADRMVLGSLGSTGNPSTYSITNIQTYAHTVEYLPGNISTQNGFLLGAITYNFTGASPSNIDDAYGLYVNSPIQGPNAIITRKWAAGFGGNVKITGSASISSLTGSGTRMVVADTNGFLSTQTVSTGVFLSSFTVSLSGGKTLGKYTNGQLVPSAGLTPEQVFNLVGIEDIAPTYTPASISLSKSATTKAEVGTTYSSNTLTCTFTQNDGGTLTNIRIQKNGVDMTPNGSTSPFVKSDSGNYVLGNITYTSYANYNAGIIKNYTPSGTPDARTPLVRNANAPQAAENNFTSNTVVLTGAYLIFYGPVASIPTTSANVRALGTNRYTDAGNVFNLNTGTTQINFSVCMPSTNTLTEVLDLDALNANITAAYTLTTFNVNDGGGNAVSYKIYTMTNAVPYVVNHRHQITIA